MFKSNKQPKISANKLGEYIKSSPSRRKVIVKDQKYPKGYIITRYSSARSAIIDFFLKGKGNKQQIKKTIESLIKKSFNSSFRQQDNDLSIKALEIFINTQIKPEIENHTITKYESDLNKLSIEGVDISVHPDVIIRGSVRGKEFIGAIKIHISKSHPLDPESGKYVATLLHKFLETTNQGKVRPEFCISLDIFSGRYFVAPRSFKSLRKDIEAACNEIRLLWNDL